MLHDSVVTHEIPDRLCLDWRGIRPLCAGGHAMWRLWLSCQGYGLVPGLHHSLWWRLVLLEQGVFWLLLKVNRRPF